MLGRRGSSTPLIPPVVLNATSSGVEQDGTDGGTREVSDDGKADLVVK